MLRAILACDSRGGIARDGTMPWPRNRLDLQHFKSLTNNNTVVMGRRTWEAADMPTPLKNRTNIVITSDHSYQATGADIIHDNVAERLTTIAKHSKVYIIGGAGLIESVLDEIGIFHITRISGNYDCDTFLPMSKITTRFECIDSVQIDQITTFETFIAGTANVLSFSAKI